MLFYNYQKDFLGIDEKDLHALGFNNLAALKAEVSDFADLFVKTPGHIHNFRHVHWIDFITCAESNEKAKAIINVNSKNYKCTIDIKTAYFDDASDKPAFLVYLNNLRTLTQEESEKISADISNKIQQKPFNTQINRPLDPTPEMEIKQEETPLSIDIDDFDTSPSQSPQPTLTPSTPPLEEDDFKLDVNFDEDTNFTPPSDVADSFDAALEAQSSTHKSVKSHTPDPVQQPTQPITTPAAVTPKKDGYVYDPHVASAELGLPLDLIEEFIQDFILQAKEFKDDLYKSLDSSDLENVKILSHKLKGVAANLRIEDAFEVLATINTTSDFAIIKTNLDELYRIIAKLAGEPEPQQIPEPETLSLEEPTEEPITEETPEKTSGTEDTQEVLEIKEEIEHEPELKLDIDLDEKLDIDLDDTLDIIELDEEQENETTLKTQQEETTVEVHYSKQLVANEIGIDLGSLKELLEDYAKESDTILHNLIIALEYDDIPAYKIELNKFKGMSENMRIKDIDPYIMQLEEISDKESVEKTIETIKTIITKILEQRD